jgi:hypothetical protein
LGVSVRFSWLLRDLALNIGDTAYVTGGDTAKGGGDIMGKAIGCDSGVVTGVKSGDRV